MNSPQDTIAAIATPLGEGGLGVIRVSGSQAIEIVACLFDSPNKTDLHTVASHTCHYGVIREPSSGLRPPSPRGRRQGSKVYPLPLGEGARRAGEGPRPIDQAVATVFRAPHSYTGEDVVEISSHGSPFVLQKILKACLTQGARMAGPGEFTERAFLSGKLDLTQAEAVADLIRARTDKAQTAALAQLEGRLAERVRGLREDILPLLAHVEVGLDHSDEDHDFLERKRLTTRCGELEASIAEILTSAQLGKILRDGLRVALVGRPNVGKSSLLNALLKEERAIVTPIAGTTRDTLEEGINWDGLPVVLTDTAGLREHTSDPIEQMGIERTRRAVESSDLVIGLFDGSEPLSEEDQRIIRECSSKSHIWVMNKTDLPRRWDPAALAALNGNAATLQVSAKTGEGLQALVEQVKQAALSQKAFSGEAQWILNVRHQEALTRAMEALGKAAEAARSDSFEECVALELKTALQALGEIIGETATEDLLDQIFSQFCVGK